MDNSRDNSITTWQFALDKIRENNQSTMEFEVLGETTKLELQVHERHERFASADLC